LASLFLSLSVVRIATSNCNISVRDAISNKTVSFLALVISSPGDGEVVSLAVVERCMHLLFGKTCNCNISD
jgi:hypothetical protein